MFHSLFVFWSIFTSWKVPSKLPICNRLPGIGTLPVWNVQSYRRSYPTVDFLIQDGARNHLNVKFTNQVAKLNHSTNLNQQHLYCSKDTHTHTHLEICTKHPFTALNVMLERRVDSRCYQEFRSRKFKHTISSLSSAFVGIRTHGTEMRNSDVWRKFIQYDKTYDAEIIALRMRVCERLPMVREKNLYTWWKLAACV